MKRFAVLSAAIGLIAPFALKAQYYPPAYRTYNGNTIIVTGPQNPLLNNLQAGWETERIRSESELAKAQTAQVLIQNALILDKAQQEEKDRQQKQLIQQQQDSRLEAQRQINESMKGIYSLFQKAASLGVTESQIDDALSPLVKNINQSWDDWPRIVEWRKKVIEDQMIKASRGDSSVRAEIESNNDKLDKIKKHIDAMTVFAVCSSSFPQADSFRTSTESILEDLVSKTESQKSKPSVSYSSTSNEDAQTLKDLELIRKNQSTGSN